jgi:ribosome biogenesis GTPase / thiamine phosphate phosphatase
MADEYKRQNTLKNIIENQQRHEEGVKRQERRQKLRLINKNLKRNQQPKPSRKKDWLEYQGEDWDEVDLGQQERVMPRGETERRRNLEKAIARKAEGKEAPVQTPQPVIEGEQGMVIEMSKGLYRVALKDRIVQCPVRGTLKAAETGYTNAVAVGDQVIVRHEGTSGSVIEAVLPRRSVLARPDVFHKHLQQIIVANVDQWLIVLSWREPILWLELLDRYLVTAERSQLPVVICLNKVDLVEDREECQAVLQPYEDLGYQVLLTSARSGEGLETLQEILQGQLTVVTGMSGVGKSSLLSAARPGLDLRVGQVSDHGEGRHTTTQATLIRLDGETAVVDTPGIREFGLSGLYQTELVEFFPEIAALASDCRFKDCRHLDEPDCAVRAAVQQGSMATSRYHSYRKIYETLPG